MSDRRTFIKNIGGLAGGLTLLPFANSVGAGVYEPESNALLIPPDTGNDEDFWGWVRESYTTYPN